MTIKEIEEKLSILNQVIDELEVKRNESKGNDWTWWDGRREEKIKDLERLLKQYEIKSRLINL